MSDTVAAAAELTIDLAAIGANLDRLRTRFTGTRMGAVVKADAYGLGATTVAPFLADRGVDLFFVAHLAEALALSPMLPAADIAVLGGLMPGEAATFAANAIIPVLNDLGQIEAWQREARRRARALPAYIHLDTGMARLGLPDTEARRLIAEPERLAGIALCGVITHPACADIADHPLTARQHRAFETLRAHLPPAPAGFCNSAALFRSTALHHDFCRVGIALWGGNPTPETDNPMAPVVGLRARILQLRSVNAGDTVGYGASWRADKPSRIATLGLGYADGYLRAGSNRAQVTIDGISCPVVGRISMDLTGVDVSALNTDRIAPGDWAEVIGPDNDIDTVAAYAGTIGYEVLTGLGHRYRRRYLAEPPSGARAPLAAG